MINKINHNFIVKQDVRSIKAPVNFSCSANYNIKDTVSFSAKPTEKKEEYGFWAKLCNMVPAGDADKIKSEFIKKWPDVTSKKMPVVKCFNMTGTPAVIYDHKNNEINLNTSMIPGLKSVDDALKEAVSLIDTAARFDEKVQAIVKKSVEKLNIPDEFVPEIYFSTHEDMQQGCYYIARHKVLLNAYWFDKANDPDVILADVIAHELSHAKWRLDFSLIKPEEIDESCLKNSRQREYLSSLDEYTIFDDYRQYRKEFAPVSEQEYERIKFYLEKKLASEKGLRRDHVKANIRRIYMQNLFEKMRNDTGLSLREVFIVDFKDLIQNNRVSMGNNEAFLACQFTDRELVEILDKVEVNKKRVKSDILKLGRFLKFFSSKMKTYTGSYDEAQSHQMAFRVAQELINEEVIEPTKITEKYKEEEYQGFLLLMLKTDPELRKLVKSGEIQLDGDLLQHIYSNKKSFGGLSLKKQEAMKDVKKTFWK